MLAGRGELEAAKRLCREAVALASLSDFYVAHAEALMDVAEVHRLDGERETAAAAIREAARLYLEDNLHQADRARVLLAQSTGAADESVG